MDRATGDVYNEGDVLRLPALARTFRALQRDPYALKNGSLAELLVEDIQQMGGIITMQDLAEYE